MRNKPPSTSFKPEIPRRSVDLPGVPRVPSQSAPQTGQASPAERPAEDNGRKLIVGYGISLSGEISACDHLVVEGLIEAKLKDCIKIDVADSGVFRGSAEVDDADIGGHFDGDLIVRGRLSLRGSGVVSGTLRYGELAVEAGGRIIGSIDPLETSVARLQGQPAGKQPYQAKADGSTSAPPNQAAEAGD
ncbi:MAG: bactofilin family protein [Inquilinaceae bacterium]